MSWCAYAANNGPFKTKKAMREAVAEGALVVLQDTAAPWFNPQPDVIINLGETSPMRAGSYTVNGPDPLGGVPNKWYATVTIDKQGKVSIK